MDLNKSELLDTTSHKPESTAARLLNEAIDYGKQNPLIVGASIICLGTAAKVLGMGLRATTTQIGADSIRAAEQALPPKMEMRLPVGKIDGAEAHLQHSQLYLDNLETMVRDSNGKILNRYMGTLDTSSISRAYSDAAKTVMALEPQNAATADIYLNRSQTYLSYVDNMVRDGQGKISPRYMGTKDTSTLALAHIEYGDALMSRFGPNQSKQVDVALGKAQEYLRYLDSMIRDSQGNILQRYMGTYGTSTLAQAFSSFGRVAARREQLLIP